MKMNESANWSSLLAESVRPYKGELAIVRRLAADPPKGSISLAIVGVDDDVAALLALRGPAECKDFFPVIQPLMTDIGLDLTLFPNTIDAVSMMSIFCLSAFGEAMSTPVELPEFKVEERLDSITGYQDASNLDKVTAALICLGYGRVDAAGDLPYDVDEAASALIKQLVAGVQAGSGPRELESAWDAYLRGFPQAFDAEDAEWRHLLLAARLVLGKFGGVPAGKVAETLHSQIKMIADAEAK